MLIVPAVQFRPKAVFCGQSVNWVYLVSLFQNGKRLALSKDIFKKSLREIDNLFIQFLLKFLFFDQLFYFFNTN